MIKEHRIKDKLIGTREVSLVLGIPEKEVIELANAHVIPHFRVAGEFLRFKKEDILRLRPMIKKKYNIPERKYRSFEKVREFVYFNDFFLISGILILVLVWIIVRDISFSL